MNRTWTTRRCIKWVWLILALVLFIPFYWLAHSGPRRARWFWVLAMFVLGMVYVPINQSAWGIFIYIAASIPEVSESTNTVIGLLLLQCGAIIAESWLFHLSAWVWSMGMGFSLAGRNEPAENEAETSSRRQVAHGA